MRNLIPINRYINLNMSEVYSYGIFFPGQRISLAQQALTPDRYIFFKSFPALPTINSARRYKLSDGLFDLFFPVRESLIVSTN